MPTNTTQNCDHTLYIDDTKSIAIELLKRKSNFTTNKNGRRKEKKRKENYAWYIVYDYIIAMIQISHLKLKK